MLAIAATRAATGHPTTSSLALTPDRFAEGKVWLLPLSALIVNGPVLPQLAALIATLAAAVRRLGPLVVVAAAVVAHVGATLIAYGVLIVFTGQADGVHNRSLDYGVSAVWLGTLGALCVALLPAARRRDPRALAVVAAGALAFIVSIAFFPLLAATEHGLAFVLGAGLTAATLKTVPGTSHLGFVR